MFYEVLRCLALLHPHSPTLDKTTCFITMIRFDWRLKFLIIHLKPAGAKNDKQTNEPNDLSVCDNWHPVYGRQWSF